jgi:hypothetical protein
VDPRLLDVLEDAADDDVRAVGQAVHVHLEGVLQEAVEEDRVLGAGLHGAAHGLGQRRLVVGHEHGAAAQHVGGAHQHRIADA